MAREKKKVLITYDGGPNKKLVIGDLNIENGGYMVFDKLPVGQEVLKIPGVKVEKLYVREIDEKIKARKSITKSVVKKPAKPLKVKVKIKYVGSQEVLVDTNGTWERDKWVNVPSVLAKKYKARQDFVVE